MTTARHAPGLIRPLLLLLALGAAAGPATAQRWSRPGAPRPERPAAPPAPRAGAGTVADLQTAIFAARDAVLPALVHVEPIQEVYRRGRKQKAAVAGSGVIVDRDGHVLTNHHVVEGASRVKCVLYDKREVAARIVGRDAFTDVAVLQLELPPAEMPRPATLGSSADLTAGQFVVAMGSPLGLARSLSVGVVSSPDRYFPEDVLPTGEQTGAYNTWIQTDAAINPGNSGGPLVDLTGRVIGINARAIPIFGENIGFAIPIDVVREVADQLKAQGHVHRSWVGASWQPLQGLADYFGAQERGGVLVGGLVPGGPAAEGGLMAGDVVVSWDGDPISARFEEELPMFRKRIADTPDGKLVRLGVLRQGRELAISVRTAQRPAADSEELELAGWGLTARDLTPELARRRRLTSLEGAIITGVRSAGPAAVAQLRAGDVIREVERRPVTNVEGLLASYRELEKSDRDRVLVKVGRGATVRLMVLEPATR